MIKQLKKTKFLIIMLILFSVFLPIKLQAAQPEIDTEKKAVLNVNFKGGKANFRLYKIASVDERLHFTMDETFTKYYSTDTDEVVNELHSQEDYNLLANTLHTYVNANNLESDASMQTDEKGQGKFENLQVGMYLLLQERTVNETANKIYPEHVDIVVLPSKITSEDGKTEEWIYEPTVKPKVVPDDLLLTVIKVEKQWDFSQDKSAEAKNKKEIYVELQTRNEKDEWVTYKDDSGEDYSKIALNEENNWQRTFENLAFKSDEWQFIEVGTMENFEVDYNPKSTEESGVTVITNKYIPPKTTTENETDKTTRSGGSNGGGGSSSYGNRKLPQTGQLWWPVYVLAGLGMAFFIVGAVKNKRYHEYDK